MNIEIAILAGGLSTRMGRDKSKLRLGHRTLLGHVRAAAQAAGWPVRVIRRDLVPRCGPLGGVFTALKTTKADAVLFLACDMPFVTPALLRKLVRTRSPRKPTVFCMQGGRAGFPFLLPREALPIVEAQAGNGALSLQTLARALHARTLRPSQRHAGQLLNINTPEEWNAAPRPRTNRSRVLHGGGLRRKRRIKSRRSPS